MPNLMFLPLLFPPGPQPVGRMVAPTFWVSSPPVNQSPMERSFQTQPEVCFTNPLYFSMQSTRQEQPSHILPEFKNELVCVFFQSGGSTATYIQLYPISLPGVTSVTIKTDMAPGVRETPQMLWRVAEPIVGLEWNTDSSHSCPLNAPARDPGITDREGTTAVHLRPQ